MSYLAMGAVTKAIAELLEKKLNKPPLMGSSVSFKVTTLPPDDERVDRDSGVNLFLYRVVEDPYSKNMDWRGDHANPVGSKRPPLALTLNYLLTAYAKKTTDTTRDDITAHQLLGNALAILHEHPVLNDVHDSDFDADLDTQFAPELRHSFEKIKISLLPISMEEFSKIWTGLSKAYRLSVAYEVSLVQIAPIVPAPVPPGPPVQQMSVQVGTLDAPMIAAIEPSAGPAGAPVTITGRGFKTGGMSTSVSVGDTTLAEADLEKLTAKEIVLTIPEAPLLGPMLPVVVSTGGRESAPVFYRVQPWITSIQPLRGATDLPLTIPLDIPAGAAVSVEIDGQPAVTTTDAVNKLIRAIVPATILTNGPKPVVVILNGGTPQRSNARFFEVLPAIQSVTVTTVASPAKTTITVTGKRLQGSDVNVRFGKLLIKKGENLDDAQVVVEVNRVLSATQPVSVLVDGRQSNTIPPRLDRIEPPEAFAGDTVMLIGDSLSGQNVIVRFGVTNVTVGPQAFSSRLSVKVPSGLAAGAIQVRVTVDGNNSNALSFEVLP
jgi:hypothetical protein